MTRFLFWLAYTIDARIAARDMALTYHPEWAASRFDAWHDENADFTLWLWRFEFVMDRGVLRFARG